MQLVMAAMTTDPCVTDAAARGCCRCSGGASRTSPAGVPPSPTSREITLALHRRLGAVECGLEGLRGLPRKRDAILRPLGSGDARLDLGQVQVEHFAEERLGVVVRSEQTLFARVSLDQIDERRRGPSASDTSMCSQSTGKSVDVAPNSGDMFDSVARSAMLEGAQSRPEEFDELADDAVRSQHLGQRQDEVGGRRARRERASGPDARATIGFGRNIGWPSIAASASMPPTPHPSTPEAVDHRRVRVGPDQGVGKDPSVARQDDSPQMLEVDLMADPHARRHDSKALERLLSPVEQRVAFAVATVFPLQIGGISVGAAKSIDLHRMIDDQIDRNEGIDPLRIAA